MVRETCLYESSFGQYFFHNKSGLGMAGKNRFTYQENHIDIQEKKVIAEQ